MPGTKLTKNVHIDLEAILTKLGFRPDALSRSRDWLFQREASLSELRVKIRKNKIVMCDVSSSWNLDSIASSILQNLKRQWGKNVKLWYSVNEKGSLAFVAEYRVPPSPSKRADHRTNNFAAIGWTLFLQPQEENLKFLFDNHFVIGEPPQSWLSDLTSSTLKSFIGKSYKNIELTSIYEFQVNVAMLLCYPMSAKIANDDLNVLRDFKFSIRSGLQVSFSEDQSTLSMNLCQQLNSIESQSYLPSIDALESRASARLYQEFDRALLDKRSDLPSSPKSNSKLDVRNILRFMISGEMLNSEIPVSYVQGQKCGMTTTSGMLRFHMSKGHWEVAMDHLRQLVKLIDENYSIASEISTLAVVLPETAGDILSHIDPFTAILAYRQALSGTDFPRLFEKIHSVVVGMNDQTMEWSVLEEWGIAERRRGFQQKILERKIVLSRMNADFETALKLIEQMMYSGFSIESWILDVLEQAAEQGYPERVIVLLERMSLKLSQNQIEGDIQARDVMSLKISRVTAKIWSDVLKKPELALAGYLKVINSPELSSSKELFDAERVLESAGRTQDVLESRMNRWRAMSKSTREKNAEVGSGILKLLFSSGDDQSAFELFCDLLEVGYIDQNAIEFVTKWSGQKANWLRLMSAAELCLKSNLIPAKILVLFARIAQDSLHDALRAAEFLKKDGVIALVDDSFFGSVLEELAKRQEFKSATITLLERLRLTSRVDRTFLLKFASIHGLTESSGDLEGHFLQEWVNSGDDLLILDRLFTLLSQENYVGANLMISVFLSDFSDKPKSESLTTSILEALSNSMNVQNIAESLNRLLELKVDQADSSQESIIYAIDYLLKFELNTVAKNYIRRAIELKFPVPVSDELVVSLFPEDSDLLGSYFLNKAITTEEADSLDYARKSIEQFKKSDLWSIDLGKAYAVLIAAESLGELDLHDLRILHKKSANKNLLLGALVVLARKSEASEQKTILLDEAANIAEHELKDPVLCFELLMEAHSAATDPATKLKLGQCAIAANRPDMCLEIFLEIFSKPECLELGGAFLRSSLEVMLLSKETRSQAGAILERLVSWGVSAGNGETVEILVEFGMMHGLATKAMMLRDVVKKIGGGDLNSAVVGIAKMIHRAEYQKETIGVILDEINSEISKLGHQNIWWQVISSLASPEKIKDFNSASKREIRYRYANWLYTLENHKAESLQRFLELRNENPLDHRIWIPLFVLLDESGDDIRTIHHLEMIIPKLEADTKLFESMPINIESLKSSLRRARQRVSERIVAASSPVESPKSGTPKFTKIEGEALRVAVVQSQLIAAIPKVLIRGDGAVASLDYSNAAINIDSAEEFHKEEITVAELDLDQQDNSSLKESQTGAIPEKAEDGSSVKQFKQSVLTPPPQLDWRMMALLQDAPQDAVQKILMTAFANETEKHIALQVAALVTGDFLSLEQWHWRTWRFSHEFGYPMSSSSRMIEANDLPSLKGPLYKFLLQLVPVISRSMKHKIVIGSFLRKKNPGARMTMNRIGVDNPVILRTGLKYFSDKLLEDRFLFVDTPEIGSEIYVDPLSRSVHFNAEYCLEKPPGFLMHRARYQIFAITSGFSSLVQPDSQSEILSLIDFLRRLSKTSPLERLKMGFATDAARMQKLFNGGDFSKYLAMLSAAEPFKNSAIAKTQQELQIYNFRVQLAGTLDLIGLVEAITGDLVTTLDRRVIKAKIDKSPIIRDLMMYATKLKFG